MPRLALFALIPAFLLPLSAFAGNTKQSAYSSLAEDGAVWERHFLVPNETRPFLFSPSLPKKPGALVVTGTFRADFDAAEGNFERVFQLDFDSAASEFNRVR